MLLQFIIQIHYMKDIQKLPLVLVETLHLYIKDGSGIHFDIVVLQDILGKAHLVVILDIHELLLSLIVVRIDLQAGNLGQIRDPLAAAVIRHPISQKRIAVKQKSSLGDAVGLIVEALREHLVEVLQLLVLQDFGMEPCHAVYGIARHNSHVSHLHLTVIDNGHLADLILYIHAWHIAVSVLDLNDETTVDLLHDLIYTGKQSGEELNGPFFQCLGHDCVVGVGTGLGGHLPRLIPGQIILIHKDPHQLCHSHGGMGIVELEGNLLIELADIIMFSHVLLNGLLHGCGDEEVLLL